jgi:hypothetical protein
VYGVGLDFATVLAVYPAVTSGNLLSFSIGGPDSRVSTLGLLGQPQGLSGSHNKFEGDSSPTRGDLYLTGNNFDLDMGRFQALYDAGKEKDNYDLQLLSDQRYAQRLASIHENPYFFNAPFSGVVGQYLAARTHSNVADLLLYSQCCRVVFHLPLHVKQDRGESSRHFERRHPQDFLCGFR